MPQALLRPAQQGLLRPAQQFLPNWPTNCKFAGGLVVKAGHILSVTRHGTLPADRQNKGGHRRLPYAASITASNFFDNF